MPKDKLLEFKQLQGEGKIVAIAGDDINDAPSFAHPDVDIATGTGIDVAIKSTKTTLINGD